MLQMFFKSGSIANYSSDNSNYSYQLNENGSVTDVGSGGTSRKNFNSSRFCRRDKGTYNYHLLHQSLDAAVVIRF
jgi:hypothetical protein